jgi:SAM-dependent methyltransferase
VQHAFFDPSTGGGASSASYCYGVWMKHLVLLWHHGMRSMPGTVLELGPGDSIGTGVATLLSGAERYVAIDAVAHMRAEANVALLYELLRLFRVRAPRPVAGFPKFDQWLDDRLFPADILDPRRLEATLAPERVERINRAVRRISSGEPDPMIEYHTWAHLKPIEDASVDLAFSHVVMGEVDDLAGVYGACGRAVRPGGWMSHQIDLTSLGTADAWNGHRAYSDLAWKIMQGKRPYFVNREPLSTHLDLMRASGFEIVEVIRELRRDGIGRDELAPRWRAISDEDHATETAFVIARKRLH